jgi:hypothetical protein
MKSAAIELKITKADEDDVLRLKKEQADLEDYCDR